MLAMNFNLIFILMEILIYQRDLQMYRCGFGCYAALGNEL